MGRAKGAVRTAGDLYSRDDTFRAGIAAWAAERRCDLRLVDILLEHGLTRQADAARWAATQPDRPLIEVRNQRVLCGPFPSCYKGDFYWYDCESSDWVAVNCHDVPRKCFGREVNYRTDKFESAAEALLFLLDNWVPVGMEPPPRPRRKRKPPAA